MATELKRCYNIDYLIYEITERGAVTRQKGEKLLHRAEYWRMFSAEDYGVLFKKNTCSFLHTHATGDRETTREEVGDARRSGQEQAYCSVPKVKKQTDMHEKLEHSKGQSCD